MQRFIAELERAEVIGPSETDFAKNAEIAARTISVNLSKLPELHYGNVSYKAFLTAFITFNIFVVINEYCLPYDFFCFKQLR